MPDPTARVRHWESVARQMPPIVVDTASQAMAAGVPPRRTLSEGASAYYRLEELIRRLYPADTAQPGERYYDELLELADDLWWGLTDGERALANNHWGAPGG